MAETRWIVDGMNVIGARPDGWWRDRKAAMLSLVESLGVFGESTGDSVVVVLDGKPFEGLFPGRNHGVEVAFATRSGRDAADDEIHRRVVADVEPSTLRVVTSDADLAHRVRRAGAQVTSAGSFRRALDKAIDHNKPQ